MVAAARSVKSRSPLCGKIVRCDGHQIYRSEDGVLSEVHLLVFAEREVHGPALIILGYCTRTVGQCPEFGVLFGVPPIQNVLRVQNGMQGLTLG